MNNQVRISLHNQCEQLLRAHDWTKKQADHYREKVVNDPLIWMKGYWALKAEKYEQSALETMEKYYQVLARLQVPASFLVDNVGELIQ